MALHSPLASHSTAENILIPTDDTQTSMEAFEGNYQIVRKVGEGTFGRVFLARYTPNPSSDPVALKKILPTCSSNRIAKEINFLKALGGQCHIPQLLDGFVTPSHSVTLVLTYLEHDSFFDILDNIDISGVLAYMRQLFEALSYIHEKGFVHCDVKPGNCLYSLKTKQFMLVDFGLAEDISGTVVSRLNDTQEPVSLAGEVRPHSGAWNATKPKSQGASNHAFGGRNPLPRVRRGGTRGFRAPEVLLRVPEQTVSLDVWSAGVVLLCILSGNCPFFGAKEDLACFAELLPLFSMTAIERALREMQRTLVAVPVDVGTHTDWKLLCREMNMSNPKLANAPDELYQLLSRCLSLAPSTRIAAEDAVDRCKQLEHIWLLTHADEVSDG